MVLPKTIKLATAAKIAGVEPNTVRTWLQRGHVKLFGFDAKLATELGLPHMITYRGTLRLAIAAKLVEVGVHPKDAWDASMHFVDMGESGAQWDNRPPRIERHPGELYPSGWTVLVFSANHRTIIVHADSLDMIPLIHPPGRSAANFPAVVLPLNELVVRVKYDFETNL